MKCISCGGKNKGSPEELGYRCPGCGHPVAVTRERDGVSDRGIANAVRTVGKSGEHGFLPEHVGYELLRRAASRQRTRRRGAAWFAAGAVILAILVDSAGFRIFLGVLAFIALLAWAAAKHPPRVDPFPAARRFLEVNPAPRPVEGAAAREPGDAERELAASAKRLLVCQRGAYADFLVGNDFHLHSACPVVGPDRDASPLFPGIVDRFRSRERPAVLVLHDLTAAGIAFARGVRDSPAWFGGHPGAGVVDLGLGPDHGEVLGPAARPLDRIRGAGRNAVSDRLPPGTGVEVTAIRPATLLPTLAASVARGVPLALAAAAAAGESKMDSE